MNQVLTIGQIVNTGSSGQPCKIGQFLGGGGQGEVYRADFNGKPVAVKWYFQQTATAEQRIGLEKLITAGPPNDRFLWPMEIMQADNVPGFGYLMPLREPRYKGIVDLMKRRVEPSFKTLAKAGLQLADSFHQLHAKGQCYRDISFGNVFFDPQTGEVLICDNDNVAFDGVATSGVLGTPRFMAPEIVRGEAAPSTQTDLFSLAVLLFYMFMVHHPLEGKKEASIHSFDLPAMTKLYGTEPLFIFDPQDNSNAPVAGYQDNALAFWPIYPRYLQNLFTKAFTEGIRDPQHGRVRETEWRTALARLRDSIVYCSNCGVENFYDADVLRETGNPSQCWACKQNLVLPFRLRVGKHVVLLNYDTQLFHHHIDDNRLYDYTQPVAEVARHPQYTSVWLLKNLTSEKWVCTLTDGTVKDVPPGRALPLANGTRVNFGKIEGEIRI